MIKKVLSIILSILILMCCFFGYQFYKNTNDEHQQIKNTIEKALKIQYNLLNKDELYKIATNEFINHIDATFYKKFQPYFINKDFMNSCRKGIGDDLIISVNVSDLKGNYIQIYTLSKKADKYRITNIQYDI